MAVDGWSMLGGQQHVNRRSSFLQGSSSNQARPKPINPIAIDSNGYIVVKRMSNAPLNITQSIPYGILLTRLFRQLDLPQASSYAPIRKPLNMNILFQEAMIPIPLFAYPPSSKGKRLYESVLFIENVENTLLIENKYGEDESQFATKKEFKSLYKEVQANTI
ncbi:hypothetical protein L1987_30608 [Smallanthus sonchifolius]|uniref:Uncharacterized protein n=1 Tax=Smallanthus sonchifolius TaxID=185202 RepID=A0ACB9I3Z1_9ASTR|nr:hypothetical protein L1987_30608 [Smallanthus sonchifolius]